MQRLKIFITIPWFTPAFRAGGPIRSIANLIKSFTDNAEYFVFCSNTDLNNEPLQVTADEWIPFSENTAVYYAGLKDRSKALTAAFENIKPDVLFIIGLFSWHFNIVPLLFCKAPRKILSVRGMLHPGALSQKSNKKWLFLAGLKTLRVTKNIIFHATDNEEQIFIQNVFGTKSIIKKAANFGRVFSPKPAPPKAAGSVKLITIALISPMKNHLLVLRALDKMSQQIEYNVYGPVKDPVYWEECKAVCQQLSENITVRYHGELLPEKVEDVLAPNHVFIMPSKSENFGHSIFEALSAGRPVITGFYTPWNNLGEGFAGINAELSAEALKNAVTFFAEMDNEGYRNYNTGARQYFEMKQASGNTMAQYRDLFFSNEDAAG